ncbi:prepilin-type N-terminal cleavage/methylation domain-containing protein [Candidatus Fermentibacteria bacterium]|nr:prepilin-type N-terminal cleavage/methylation domain-containing protein [Candidatus Fermentibacteria bacterium]
MSRNDGFTLVETMVASVIILVVLTSLALSVRFFALQTRKVESRRSALVIANAEASGFESADTLPDPGTDSRTVVLTGDEYTVTNRVLAPSDDSRRIDISVATESGGSIKFSRMMYR